MRIALTGVLVSLLAFGCGGDGGNDPDDPFPDVAGRYQIEGTFDDLPTSEASFEGTLELTQASQESGDLEGSISVLVTIGGEDIDIRDNDLSPATVSPTGEISFMAADPGGTWTFTGTHTGSGITDGRHTLSDGTRSFSGPWTGDQTSAVARPAAAASRAQDLLQALRARVD